MQDTLAEMIGFCDDLAIMRRRVGSKREFMNDKMTQYAFCTPLEQIGEHAKRIDLWLSNHSDYEWSKVMRFRDLVTHHYSTVDFGIVWSIIENDVPPLYEELIHLRDECDSLPDQEFVIISSRKQELTKKRKTFWDIFQRNKYRSMGCIVFRIIVSSTSHLPLYTIRPMHIRRR